jgi:hypothetical protein
MGQISRWSSHSRLLLTLFAIAGTTLGHISADRGRRYTNSTNQHTFLNTFEHIPPPPAPEPIEIIEFPLPPVSASRDPGACTAALNPHRTGCIAQHGSSRFQTGDFTADVNKVIATVTFVGAPVSLADTASIYDGIQLILIKADGTNFSNGDPWKCLTCGVPGGNQDLEELPASCACIRTTCI